MRVKLFFLFFFFLISYGFSISVLSESKLELSPITPPKYLVSEGGFHSLDFFLLNSGSRQAKIIDARLTNTNFKIFSIPKVIDSGFSSKVSFTTKEVGCLSDSVETDFVVKYINEGVIEEFVFNNFSLNNDRSLFFSKILPGGDYLLFDVFEGGRVFFELSNNADSVVDVSFLVNYSNLDLRLVEGGVSFDMSSFEGEIFSIPPRGSKFFTVLLSAVKPTDSGFFEFEVFNIVCGGSFSFSKRVGFVNSVGAFFEVETLPGLSFFSLFFVFFFCFLFSIKFIE